MSVVEKNGSGAECTWWWAKSHSPTRDCILLVLLLICVELGCGSGKGF